MMIMAIVIRDNAVQAIDSQYRVIRPVLLLLLEAYFRKNVTPNPSIAVDNMVENIWSDSDYILLYHSSIDAFLT